MEEFEKCMRQMKLKEKTRITVLDGNKFDEYNKMKNQTWEQYCDMFVFDTTYGELVNSNVYDLCKKLEVSLVYKNRTSIVFVLEASKAKIKEIINVAKDDLITRMDIENLVKEK